MISDFERRLREAFPAVPLDFAQALTGGTDEGEFRRHVDGKAWTELDPALVGRRSDVLSFLQPVYFVAVLPAFLKVLVEADPVCGAPDTLVVVLDREQEPRFEKVARHLTDAQRAMVLEALERFASSSSGTMERAARKAAASWTRQRGLSRVRARWRWSTRGGRRARGRGRHRKMRRPSGGSRGWRGARQA